jgi:hypothetical protein
LSSAILYLAIVAIWAGVLVPRWLRPAQVVRPAHAHEAAPPEARSDTEPIPRVAVEHERRALRPDADAAQRRQVILRARRRMLVMISGLTAGAVAIAVAHLAAWWVVVPPGFMLGGFLVILREAAHTDAERARRLGAEVVPGRAVGRPVSVEGVGRAAADEAAVAAAGGVGAAAAGVGAAGVAADGGAAPSWTAEIIDISARLGDQLYDQYADAAVRAVGD